MHDHTIQDLSDHTAERRPLFRKLGVFYVPSSMNGWLLLFAAIGTFIHASHHSDLAFLSASSTFALSIPPLILYHWVARGCSRIVDDAANILDP
ncbi:MAG: hypothetical protein NTV54_13555 [Ignavibacteriales bacterium]|nr:hypothetical protein [Ignavibacteriales bacterium]